MKRCGLGSNARAKGTQLDTIKFVRDPQAGTKSIVDQQYLLELRGPSAEQRMGQPVRRVAANA